MREVSLVILLLIQITSIILVIKNYKFSNSVINTLMLFVFLMIGMRQIGYDLDTYEMIYNWYAAGLTYRVMEPSISFIASFSSRIGIEYSGFLLIYAFITLYLLYLINSKIHKKYYFSMILYIVLFMASGAVVSIRATVASLAITLGVYYFGRKKYFSYVFWLFVGILFHYSSIIVLFLTGLLKIKNKSIIILIVVTTSFCLFLLFPLISDNLGLSQIDRLIGYLNKNSYENYNSAVVVQQLRIFIIVISSLYILYAIKDNINTNHSIELVFYNIVLISLVFYVVTLISGNLELGKRIYEITAIPIIFLISKYKTKKIIYAVVLIGISNLGYLYMGYLSTVDHYTIHIRDIQP